MATTTGRSTGPAAPDSLFDSCGSWGFEQGPIPLTGPNSAAIAISFAMAREVSSRESSSNKSNRRSSKKQQHQQQV